MTGFDFISFLASIASLILAVLAIWLSLYQKNAADRTNDQVRDLLLEVKSDAKAIANVAMPELQKYGEAMREHVLKKTQGIEKTPPQDPSGPTETPSAQLLEKFSAVANQIDQGDRFSNKERDHATYLLKKIKEGDIDRGSDFLESLEKVVDSFAGAAQNAHMDMIDDLFYHDYHVFPGIVHTMVIHYGLRLLTALNPDVQTYERFIRHTKLSKSLGLYDIALPSLLVYERTFGEPSKVTSLIQELSEMEQPEIEKVVERIRSNRIPHRVSRIPDAGVRRLSERYSKFWDEYGTQLEDILK